MTSAYDSPQRLTRDTDGPDADAAADAQALEIRAVECYRTALKAADPAESDHWISAGAWFERMARQRLDGGTPAGGTAQVLQFPVDRRRSPRVPLRGGALMAAGGEIFIVRTEDMSRGGACLVAPETVRLTAGEEVVLSVPGVCFDRRAEVVAADGARIRVRFGAQR
ncbi:MAG TPA: PilZ domain-containing protein [Azospirillaceae bacterium]|nr:PilZ domain-containing protein [Azospirillaceae bacterium]